VAQLDESNGDLSRIQESKNLKDEDDSSDQRFSPDTKRQKTEDYNEQKLLNSMSKILDSKFE